MMLAKENTPRYATRSTHVIILVTNKRRTLQWPAQSMEKVSEKARVGHIEAQSACKDGVTKSQGAHACYSSDVPFYILQFLHRCIISSATMYSAVIATAGGHTMY